MEDQTRSGPGGGGSAMGGGSNPTPRDFSATPGLGEQSGLSASSGSPLGSSSDGLGLATTSDTGTPPVGMRQQARDSVRDARELLKTQGREKLDQAKQSADRMVGEKKGALTDTMSALTAAFDAAASSLSDGGQTRLADWTRELSGRARRIATYLDESDTRGLVTDLEDTARQNPTAFVGTSFAAGLAAGRFLRASARPQGVGDMSSLDGGAGVDFDFEPDPALLDESQTDVFGATASGEEPTRFSQGFGGNGGMVDPSRNEGGL